MTSQKHAIILFGITELILLSRSNSESGRLTSLNNWYQNTTEKLCSFSCTKKNLILLQGIRSHAESQAKKDGIKMIFFHVRIKL